MKMTRKRACWDGQPAIIGERVQVRQSAQVKSQKESPTDGMAPKNDIQDRSRITADDDAVPDDRSDSVVDPDQTLVRISSPKLLEQAASKLVAQLSEETSTSTILEGLTMDDVTSVERLGGVAIANDLEEGLAVKAVEVA